MPRLRTWFCSLAFAGLMTASLFAADDKLKINPGDKFPVVALPAAQIEKVKKGSKELSIADLKGKVVVVFFYPKASTKGCTIESCGFRDLAKEFPEDVVLIGASADNMAAQNKFIQENNLPYPLLCDTELKLIKELGIKNAKSDMPQRITFVVDREGTVKKVYNQVKVSEHPKDVLADVKEIVKKK